MTTLGPAAAGLATGLSLIVAIGAQNAFVLRQGLARQYVVPVVAICAVADLLLILAGVAGIGTVVEEVPWAVDTVRWLGAAFLAAYGVRSLLGARRAGSLEAARAGARSRRAAVATALALTFLNPHVYLDTVLLLGSIANQHGTDGRWWFAGGATAASVLWFTGLGFGARAGHRLLSTVRAWQVLDVVIGLTMLAIAVLLVAG
ncbi:LysE/ArgO family amino acid transporter [Nocardioides sp. TF02-7]|uniref:LysE/ArgO family amino acid transporter n=1 Tax=Nocardioides sp. TF02-7 TaxID=2917724 RepID=UPI001F05FF98|nr:LysE/ArgO family amino acid transporter [Nocardioides sp. TF02-7]UMG94247.1 LysE/ArgO family amino acid transporter [Nocardioides sp. TF02-7]